MKRTLALVFAILILSGLMANAAFACRAGCGCCGSSLTHSATVQQQLVFHVNLKNLPHQAATLLTSSVKQSAKLAAHLPRHFKRQLQVGSDKAQVAVRAATGQTQNTFQRISAGVTSLSLQLLRGVCSYFWALLSGLLR